MWLGIVTKNICGVALASPQSALHVSNILRPASSATTLQNVGFVGFARGGVLFDGGSTASTFELGDFLKNFASPWPLALWAAASLFALLYALSLLLISVLTRCRRFMPPFLSRR